VQNFSGPALTRLRRERNLTRTELAALVHRTDQSVSLWELGRIVPRPEQIGALVAALQCTVSDLFADDGRPDPALEYLRDLDRRRGVPEHVTDPRALQDGAALFGRRTAK
jgi:transcriptional regulator with XRE-family HTH domain